MAITSISPFFKPLIAVPAVEEFIWIKYMGMDTTGGPPLTCDQQGVESSSEVEKRTEHEKRTMKNTKYSSFMQRNNSKPQKIPRIGGNQTQDFLISRK